MSKRVRRRRRRRMAMTGAGGRGMKEGSERTNEHRRGLHSSLSTQRPFCHRSQSRSGLPLLPHLEYVFLFPFPVVSPSPPSEHALSQAASSFAACSSAAGERDDAGSRRLLARISWYSVLAPPSLQSVCHHFSPSLRLPSFLPSPHDSNWRRDGDGVSGVGKRSRWGARISQILRARARAKK